jgi:proteasome alpha subunit
MSMPFYVAPEQLMKDRADYARKGIARGRALIGAVWQGGILIVAENPSRSLHKLSEIYDRIAFGGVGKYNEFDQLRVAGIRHADVKGYSYAREDVDARSLANLYAQYLGTVFTHEMKPLEVEILVAELGNGNRESQLFQILYDGTVMDERDFAVLGGDADSIAERFRAQYDPAGPREALLRSARDALSGARPPIGANDLEVVVLEDRGERRCFRRLEVDEVRSALGEGAEGSG